MTLPPGQPGNSPYNSLVTDDGAAIEYWNASCAHDGITHRMEHLNVVDREIDRKQAEERVKTVRDKMSGVPFVLIVGHVVNMITSGRQNMSTEDSQEFGRRIGDITKDDKIGDSEKSRALGFLILDMMGPKFLDVLINDDAIQQLTHEAEQLEQILDRATGSG